MIASSDINHCRNTERSVVLAVAPALLLLSHILLAAGNPAAETSETMKSGSRCPYYHLITLYDEDGEAIAPDDEPAQPWSPDRTCGKCHDVNAVRRGFHFDHGADKAGAERPGEPWVVTDPDAVTQIPISWRAWPGARHPHDTGLTAWSFLLHFGRHSPGNIGPALDAGRQDPKARWDISGALDIDCLMCHNADGTHNPAAQAAQVGAQNFKWSPTAAGGFASVKGEAAKAPDDWDPMFPPDPDHPEQAGPRVEYDQARFNPDNRVHIAVTRRIPPERCWFCHTTREAAPKIPEWLAGRDVHLASGMICVDCHRNSIDHQITRGAPAENTSEVCSEQAALTCRGCHLGETASGRPLATAGRAGAPRPLHRGLPAFHLRSLSCTACHSGLRPTADTRFVQTSRAHALGLGRKGRREDALPRIVEPVFLRDGSGVITPHRALWPAFFGILQEGRVIPIPPEKVLPHIPDRPRRKSHAQRDRWSPFTDEKLKAVLEALEDHEGAAKDGGRAVYVCAGRRWFLDNGRLVSSAGGREARMYAWAVGHDVRPSAQALGARGCLSCHGENAAFFFGAVRLEPTVEGHDASVLRANLMRCDPQLMKAWAKVLRFQGVILAALIVSGLVMLGTLFHYALLGVSVLATPTPRAGPRDNAGGDAQHAVNCS